MKPQRPQISFGPADDEATATIVMDRAPFSTTDLRGPDSMTYVGTGSTRMAVARAIEAPIERTTRSAQPTKPAGRAPVARARIAPGISPTAASRAPMPSRPPMASRPAGMPPLPSPIHTGTVPMPARTMAPKPVAAPPPVDFVPPPPSEMLRGATMPLAAMPVARVSSAPVPYAGATAYAPTAAIPVASVAPASPYAPAAQMAAVPQRQSLPSVVPVSMDRSADTAPAIVTEGIPTTSSRRAAWKPIAIGAAAAMGFLFAAVGGRAMSGPQNVTVAVAAAPQNDAVTFETAESTAPAVAPATLHRLTPTELFPPQAAEPTKQEKLTPAAREQYKRDKARIAHDLANRNAPVPVLSYPTHLRSGVHGPSIDQLVRGERLRGDKD